MVQPQYATYAIDRRSAILANVVLLGLFVVWAWLNARQTDLYLETLQEDAIVEWLTFWGFIIATGAFAATAVHQYRGGTFPWFATGFAVLSFVIAMEEISWGQRILGYRPPEYFLTQNFQQELNVHNIAGRGLRKWAFRGILAGYGVLLPALQRHRPTRKLFRRLGVLPPPLALSFAFIVMIAFDAIYPWKFSGELVEGAMGLAFMFGSLAAYHQVAEKRTAWDYFTIGLAVALVLGVASTVWSQQRGAADDERTQVAQSETEALKQDLLTVRHRIRKWPTKCGLQKRFFTIVEQYKFGPMLLEGTFVPLAGERGPYFIDPWNSPYWVRHSCDRATKRNSVFVFSFGPNRRRDSTPFEIKGDDVGVYLRK